MSLAWYLTKNKLLGRKKFPLTMILEPLEKCNLACEGCGRIREYESVKDRMMAVEDCLAAVEECRAPVVSISGGEPLLHPHIDEIVAGVVSQRRFVYLCTNGLLMKQALKVLRPSRYFAFVVHLDGLRETHDRAVARRGVYDVAIGAIQMARREGFRVCTNTTLYKGTHAQEFHELFALLNGMGVEGIMVSPAFQYREQDKDIFLGRQEAVSFFRDVLEGCPYDTPFYNNPLYLDFLKGKREYHCRPWAMPTRTPLGWRQPCYLIADQHVGSFRELMETTAWESYGFGRDPRCATCMMHCGYEGSTILEAMEKPRVALEMATRALFLGL
jgi:hopanoid biosynthesis associated radical SAM protein HpnH